MEDGSFNQEGIFSFSCFLLRKYGINCFSIEIYLRVLYFEYDGIGGGLRFYAKI